jgi:hypothetical protein
MLVDPSISHLSLFCFAEREELSLHFIASPPTTESGINVVT